MLASPFFYFWYPFFTVTNFLITHILHCVLGVLVKSSVSLMEHVVCMYKTMYMSFHELCQGVKAGVNKTTEGTNLQCMY